jgi:hypothetical protein
MASMLRSGKFFRLFSNLTRSFDLNNGGRSNNELLLGARRGEWETNIQRFVVFQLIIMSVKYRYPRDSIM